MKETRNITIRDRVFYLGDLKRISRLFENQERLAKKSEHHYEIEYQVCFSDGTSIKSTSAEILDEGVLNRSARPMQVWFSFHNWDVGRQLCFRVTHGDGSYASDATVEGGDSAWVADNFNQLAEAIAATKPQEFWFRRHPTLLLAIVALGAGLLARFLGLSIWSIVLSSTGVDAIIKENLQHWAADTPWRPVLLRLEPVFYAMDYGFFWLMGYTWAWSIRSWILELWPNIELNIGCDHLKTEQKRRNRLRILVVLIVIPILMNLATEWVRRFH